MKAPLLLHIVVHHATHARYAPRAPTPAAQQMLQIVIFVAPTHLAPHMAHALAGLLVTVQLAVQRAPISWDRSRAQVIFILVQLVR